MDCEQLDSYFERLGVPVGAPGFCDHPAFMSAEQRDPSLLTRYAEYVHCKGPESEEVGQVETLARAVTEAVADAINHHGTGSACVDAALATSWILSKLGIWNFVVAGGLVVTEERTSGPYVQRFSQYDMRPVDAGHAWVVAPPFWIVDGALQNQPYQDPTLGQRLPKTIVSEGEPADAAQDTDYCSDDLIRGARVHHQARSFLSSARRTVDAIAAVVPPRAIETGAFHLKYVPCAVTAKYPGWSADIPKKVGVSARRLLTSIST